MIWNPQTVLIGVNYFSLRLHNPKLSPNPKDLLHPKDINLAFKDQLWGISHLLCPQTLFLLRLPSEPAVEDWSY